MKRINEAGLELLIERYEGVDLNAYPDPATGGAPWTIGYGHTGVDVHQGLIITEERAKQLLAQDLIRFESQVDILVPVATPNQFAALVSFAYNEGCQKLRTSTLLRLHNAGNYANVVKEFPKWVYANGEVMPGLIKRRAAEAALYSTP